MTERTTTKGAATLATLGRPTARPTRAAIAQAVEVLSANMRRLHGGEWAAAIDHKARFILIRERIAAPRPLHRRKGRG